MRKNKDTTSKKTFLFWAGFIVILLSIGAIYLNRTHINKSLFSRNNENAMVSSDSKAREKDASTINYGPSTPADNEQINEQKKNADSTTPPQTSSSITATITNTRTANSLAQISVLVQGTAEGTCKLTLRNNSGKLVEKTSQVVARGNLVTCNDFDVPVSQLSTGVWNVDVVIVTASAKSNVATSSLQVGS